MEAQKPNLFQYQDFRIYLKDVFEYHKEYTIGFSLRTLAKEMELNTHAHFFDVMYGRTLTDKFIPQYVKWLKLSGNEVPYFEALVHYDQAKRSQDKQLAFQTMVRLSPQLETLQMGARYVRFFEKWYQPILMTLLTIHPKEKDPELLARLFQPRIKPAQIEEALNLFKEYDLVHWDDSMGEWVLQNRFLKAEDTTRKMALRPYHLKMQELGMHHYDAHYEQQQFASMTLATTEKTVLKVREIIKNCRQQIMDTVRQDPDQELLLQVNMQTFEIVRKR